MSVSKKLFIVLAALFFMIILYFTYDIASRTSFPGSKSNVEEGLSDPETDSERLDSDSIKVDSISN